MVSKQGESVAGELRFRRRSVPVRVVVDEAAADGYVLEPSPEIPVGQPMALWRSDGSHALVVVVNDHGRFLMSGPFH